MSQKERYSSSVRYGVWEVVPAESTSARPWSLARLSANLQALGQRATRPFENVPVVYRLVREIVRDASGYAWLTTWFACRVLGSVYPAIDTILSVRFYHTLEGVIATRTLAPGAKRAIAQLAIMQTGLMLLYNSSSWLQSRADQALSQRMHAVFSGRLLRAYLSTSVEALESRSRMSRLALAADMIGLNTGGRGDARFSRLFEGLGSFFNVFGPGTQALALYEMVKSRPDERIFALLGFLHPLLLNLISNVSELHYRASRIINQHYLDMRAAARIGTSSKYKVEVEALALGSHLSRSYESSVEALGSTPVPHPTMSESSYWLAEAQMNIISSVFERLPILFAAVRAVYTNKSPFSIVGAQMLSQRSAGLSVYFDSLLWRLRTTGGSASALESYKLLLNVEDESRPLRLPEGSLELPSASTGPSIEFRNVSYHYPGTKKPALDDFSLKLDSGDLAIVVGMNGSGKSTFLKLLCRLFDPDSGVILLNGVDIRQYRLEDVRKSMAICWQQPLHFPVTISDDISFGDLRRAATVPGSIEEAAKLGGAHDFISALPDAYDTTMRAIEGGEHDDDDPSARRRHRWPVNDDDGNSDTAQEDEKGDGHEEARPFLPPPVNFSGGQWQRLSLSRTMMRVPGANLLAFDEPSASLDPKAEFELFERLSVMKGDKTCLFISHRFGSFNRKADKVFLLDKGKVVEDGTHEELMERNGSLYKKLYEYQASSFTETKQKKKEKKQ